VDGLTVADADPERAARVAAAVGAACVATPEELPAAGIDALVIAAATPAHPHLVGLAAEAGLPCFCEKPIALDLPTTDAVLDHVRRAGILLQIGFQRRFDAGYRAAREAVGSGAIGDVHLVRLAGHDPTPPPEEYVAASGGIFTDLAVHDFDIAAWVLGRPVVEVYADGVASDPLFARHNDVGVAAAVLRFDGDVMGVLSAARSDPRGYDIRMELFGSRDSVAVGLDSRTPLRSLEPGVPAPAEEGWRDFMERFRPAYRAELEGFLQSVRDGSQSLCGGDEARRALIVALAANRSRSERRPVAVAEVG
jgi:myo-inositol 2-dehydrogenase/D-chiro-inositol 1-dehydrogenase